MCGGDGQPGGSRICILGPSNSGKSTLAQAIARKQKKAVIHLDQLFHQPHTDWKPRPEAEVVRLHDQAIKADAWVMEGNYSLTLSQRLERATGLILLDLSTTASLFRYVRRAWFERDRPGVLEGGQDSVKWKMIHHIAVVTPKNRTRQDKVFKQFEKPKLKLATPVDLKRFYRNEDLGCETLLRRTFSSCTPMRRLALIAPNATVARLLKHWGIARERSR